MRLALLIAWLPALALAQTTTPSGLTLQVNGHASQVVSAADCGNTSLITWSVSVPGNTPCSNLVIWASDGSCGDALVTGVDLPIQTIDQATWSSQLTGTVTVKISDLPLGAADAGVTCGAAIEKTVNICAALTVSGFSVCSRDTETIVHSSPATTIDYDAVAPEAPSITDVVPLDGALRVSVGIPSGADIIFVQYRPQGTAQWLSAAHLSNEQGGTTIDGLTNGTTYEISAYAQDAAGNQSGLSPVATGSPQEAFGFWTAYKQAGGNETGGCTAAGGGLFGGVLLLLGLAWRKR